MYKRRLLSFVAFLLELTTSVLALIPEKKGEDRKVEKKNKKERNNHSIWKTSNREMSRSKYQMPPRHLKSIKDVECGMRSCLRV